MEGKDRSRTTSVDEQELLAFLEKQQKPILLTTCTRPSMK